jgi:hypothetical protein
MVEEVLESKLADIFVEQGRNKSQNQYFTVRKTKSRGESKGGQQGGHASPRRGLTLACA